MSNALLGLRGGWAVVTGASSGIGLCFAEAIAKAGLNLVVLGRNQEKLAEVACRLHAEYRVVVEPLVMDFFENDSVERLLAEIDRLGVRVALLINNAGVGYWGEFERADNSVYRKLITLNVYVPMALTAAFSEHLAQIPKGIVINVSSAAVLQPVPYMAVYAASKSALHQFGLALYEEWRQRGVQVQTLVVGPTDTDFDVKSGLPSHKVSSVRGAPQHLVERSLTALNHNDPLVFGPGVGFWQRLFGAFTPISVVLKVVGRMFRP